MVQLIPRIYPRPFGGPLFWMDEQSGVLRDAVDAYLNHVLESSAPAPTAEQLALVIDYCDYWVHAPAWRDVGFGLARLRWSIKTVRTVAELRQWLREALGEGIDPL